MNKSQFRTMMLDVLCGPVAVIAGCQEEAASPKAKEVKATPAAEKPAAAVKPAAAAKPAPAPAPAPVPAPKPAAAIAGPTLGPFNLAKNWAEEQDLSPTGLSGHIPNPGERPDNTGFGTDYLKNYGGEMAFVPSNGMEIKRPDGTVAKFQPYHASGTDIIFGDVDFLALSQNRKKSSFTVPAGWIQTLTRMSKSGLAQTMATNSGLTTSSSPKCTFIAQWKWTRKPTR